MEEGSFWSRGWVIIGIRELKAVFPSRNRARKRIALGVVGDEGRSRMDCGMRLCVVKGPFGVLMRNPTEIGV